jgi:hypothetical protein
VHPAPSKRPHPVYCCQNWGSLLTQHSTHNAITGNIFATPFIHIRHMTPSATIVFVHLINMEDVRFSHGLDVHHRRTGEKMMGIILSTHQPVPE